MRPTARRLTGNRLHLQHGPSDLIIWAEGDRDQAHAAAIARFDTIIAEIVEELADLREMLTPLSQMPDGSVARRMHDACLKFADVGYLTRMAAVAGSIADEVLAAMRQTATLSRAYVNNGGDIALFLAPGMSFRTAIRGHDGTELGRVEIAASDGVGGIATSGRHGRSLSLGIADSVTVLATSAAQADVAATLIANAVDVPGHAAIERRPACELDESSDLGTLPVVVDCGSLDNESRALALAAGCRRAHRFQSDRLITSAGLFLQGSSATTRDMTPSPRAETTPLETSKLMFLSAPTMAPFTAVQTVSTNHSPFYCQP